MTLPKKCLSILQLSDTHILASPDATLLGVNTAYYFKAVLEQAIAEQKTFDLIMLTGDLAQNPVRDSYSYILDYLSPYQIPTLCLPGNHDDFAIMQNVLNTEQIHCRKSVIVDKWQIISLNSQIIGAEGGYLSEQELEFLENSLAAHPGQHTLIAVHHHSVPTESAWMDTMLISNHAAFFDVLKRHPQVKLLINGHIHQEMDLHKAMIRILGTPSTCFQFKPKSVNFALDSLAPAYRHLQLYADGTIDTHVVRLKEALVGLINTTKGY